MKRRKHKHSSDVEMPSHHHHHHHHQLRDAPEGERDAPPLSGEAPAKVFAFDSYSDTLPTQEGVFETFCTSHSRMVVCCLVVVTICTLLMTAMFAVTLAALYHKSEKADVLMTKADTGLDRGLGWMDNVDGSGVWVALDKGVQDFHAAHLNATASFVHQITEMALEMVADAKRRNLTQVVDAGLRDMTRMQQIASHAAKQASLMFGVDLHPDP